mmetsp:Transcript_36425/g.117682  ORF Transcript_36425/g.117682 Transcript_36425/m.117682 type:complete len:292 (-) Transcript_36425:245-1120(-)
MGFVPYILFLHALRRRRAAPLLVLELPNCSRSHYQDVVPSVPSFRAALETLLRREFGVARSGEYVLLGHSLGTDYCSMVMNDPRLAESARSEVHEEPPLRPARLVLMDPVCFLHESAESHRLPFWTVGEAMRKAGAWWRWPVQLLLLLLVIRDESNQEVTKRALVPGTDTLFRASPELLRRCATLVTMSGKDQALPAWEIHDYLRAHFPEIEVRMDPGLEHGGFLLPFVPGWLARSVFEAVLTFVGASPPSPALPRVASLPGVGGAPMVDGSPAAEPMLRRNRSRSSSRLV